MKVVLLLVLLSHGAALACEVALSKRLLVLGGKTLHAGVQGAACDASLATDLVSILQDIEGNISSGMLERMLQQRGQEDVKITPSNIEIVQLPTVLRRHLTLPASTLIAEARARHPGAFVALADGDEVRVVCPECTFRGKQEAQVGLQDSEGAQRSLKVEIDFRNRVRVFRLVNSLPAFASVNAETDLREEYQDSLSYGDTVVDPATVRFFKTNKPLKRGELLRLADLSSIQLVRAGLKTEIILESSAIKIKTQGISRSSGAWGDTVEVFHQQKNRKYQGKVIDMNKVLVEL